MKLRIFENTALYERRFMMSVIAMLYSSITTIISTIFATCFVFFYMKDHKSKDGLFALLFISYIISDLMHVLFVTGTLGENCRESTIYILSLILRCWTYIVYFLMVYKHTSRELTLEEQVCLLAGSIFVIIFALLPATSIFYAQALVFVPIWGVWRLARQWKEPRSLRLLVMMGVLAAGKIVTLLFQVFQVNLAQIFVEMNDFSYTLPSELILAIVILTAAWDLMDNVKQMLVKAADAGQKADAAEKMPVFSLEASIQKLAEKYALTKRESEICLLMAEGKSNKEIAEELFISEGTVKVHLHNIFQKLEITKRGQLITLLQ